MKYAFSSRSFVKIYRGYVILCRNWCFSRNPLKKVCDARCAHSATGLETLAKAKKSEKEKIETGQIKNEQVKNIEEREGMCLVTLGY